ncbi:hypothetical protein, variant 3 [Phialophora macrospora]|uniref:Uncharacterized protein n=1 Tax=Phialophora macrospora TaxID=1851006 RepID=A0A0D2D0U7_9EURO|nr:hypothetical protein PV04_03277 [Phialophora macrospora]KIW71064.1 hypothetical protein, variant 1 [Phialophora macrospora]KIW71065.1 hypothetical protein, variant 2 [Phialophora macrospora]KIW71066.1 hypothetical protein, variant 3 [Phialophora macrospora]
MFLQAVEETPIGCHHRVASQAIQILDPEVEKFGQTEGARSCLPFFRSRLLEEVWTSLWALSKFTFWLVESCSSLPWNMMSAAGVWHILSKRSSVIYPVTCSAPRAPRLPIGFHQTSRGSSTVRKGNHQANTRIFALPIS